MTVRVSLDFNVDEGHGTEAELAKLLASPAIQKAAANFVIHSLVPLHSEKVRGSSIGAKAHVHECSNRFACEVCIESAGRMVFMEFPAGQ